MERGLIQVAGVHNLAEVKMLLAAGVDQIAIPLRLSHWDEDISESKARKLIEQAGNPEKFVLITYQQNPAEIIEFCEYLNVTKVQIHSEVKTAVLQQLSQKKPGLEIIKSLIVRGDNLNQLEEYINKTYQFVDWYITDTFDPKSGAKGATGKTHDWNISRSIVEVSPRPVILAGGLNPENVARAVQSVRPNGVDVHTGLENKDGLKDPKLVHKFVQETELAYTNLTISMRKLEIDGVLDLHTFLPADVKELVPNYLDECIKEGLSEIRIIHGKGQGVLRRIVRSILSSHPQVLNFCDAPEHGGNWGATVATLATDKN